MLYRYILRHNKQTEPAKPLINKAFETISRKNPNIKLLQMLGTKLTFEVRYRNLRKCTLKINEEGSIIISKFYYNYQFIYFIIYNLGQILDTVIEIDKLSIKRKEKLENFKNWFKGEEELENEHRRFIELLDHRQKNWKIHKFTTKKILEVLKLRLMLINQFSSDFNDVYIKINASVKTGEIFSEIKINNEDAFYLTREIIKNKPYYEIGIDEEICNSEILEKLS